MDLPTPDPTPVHASQAFECHACGGALAYVPQKGVACQHCRSAGPPALLAPTTAGPRELALSSVHHAAAAGLGVPTQSVSCGECGAVVQCDAHARSTRCAYCASFLLTRQPTVDAMQPESLIPFSLDERTATQRVLTWLEGGWFRPSDLKERARLDGAVGIYVPYWTFDAVVESRWTGDRGDHYYETVQRRDAKGVLHSDRIQHTRWSARSGHRRDAVDDLLVCASRGIDAGLAEQLGTFATAALVPYAPGFVLGWRVERYAIDVTQAWSTARGRIEAQQAKRCAGDVGGDTHRNVQVQNVYGRETYKHVLLPLFVLAYRYRDKPRRVLVNGQTGEVVGHVPRSLPKILAVCAALLGVSVLLTPLLPITICGLLAFAIYAFGKREEWFD
jgi:hypothetical protein